MPSYLTQILLDFSEDPVSDASPTWQDVTSDLVTCEWWAGIDSEGDEPQPGGAQIRMKNINRRWEPDYVAGMFYPNVTTQRRFRLRLNDGTGLKTEFVAFVAEIGIEYPADTEYSEVVFTCGDGTEVLALDDLDEMDPPDAASYADVVAFDRPWGHWRLGDPEGTAATARLKHVTWTLHMTRGRKRKIHAYPRYGTNYRTASEASGVAGTSGVYKNNPTLGVEGLIVGDLDTAVQFASASSQYVRVPLDDQDKLHKANAVTVEAWVKPTSLASNFMVIAGPLTGGSVPIFRLDINADGSVDFDIVGGPGVSSGAGDVSVGNTAHLVGTWDGTTSRVYVNSVLQAEATSGGPMSQPAANGFLHIGTNGNGGEFANAVIDEAAVYEYALTGERVLAHYQAGAERGFPMQTAAERLDALSDTALWTAFQYGGDLEVQPVFSHGQARLGEIGETAHSQGPQAMFHFEGDGTPVFFGHEWKAASAAHNTTQATFGDGAGEIPCHVELVYDNEVFNDVTVSHESGPLANATDSTSISDKGRRANSDYTDVLLMHHVDVEALAAHVLALYKEPALRPVTVTINGAKAARQILDLEIGHQIRVKKRGEGGTAIDRVTNIIGKRKVLTVDRHLMCTYNLARGFNASLSEWHLGINGYSELGSTTVLA